ncbi:MAG: MBL fold metallo-hydrolase [Kiritimatiellales bacterium]|nr:MBL fold metallo-hydrolase [Kiritimatiellales bacterium]
MKTARYKINELEILAIPVLHDNFVYLVCRDGRAVLIDAGEAEAVFRTLETFPQPLDQVLITHNHHDHTGCCRRIQDRLNVPVMNPGIDAKAIQVLGTTCSIISTPGHTRIHKVYHFPEQAVLFAGDTLINGACGRILDGTAEQLFSSLWKIRELPDETRIFGGHDYLEENMNFALSVAPDNAHVKARLELYRTDPAAAIFATLAEEKKTNPFLCVDTVEELAELRRRKDSF